MGNLASLQPMLSPMLWTSIATGKRPLKHGVHGFSEVEADTGEVAADLAALAHQGDLEHPSPGGQDLPRGRLVAEPSGRAAAGRMVSDLFKVAAASWTSPGRSSPARSIRRSWPINSLRCGSIRPNSKATCCGPSCRGRRRSTRRKTVASRCSPRWWPKATVHAAATHLLHARPDWDFFAVYQDAIDHFCHGFMRYHPPRLEWSRRRISPSIPRWSAGRTSFTTRCSASCSNSPART